MCSTLSFSSNDICTRPVGAAGDVGLAGRGGNSSKLEKSSVFLAVGSTTAPGGRENIRGENCLGEILRGVKEGAGEETEGPGEVKEGAAGAWGRRWWGMAVPENPETCVVKPFLKGAMDGPL